MLVSVGMRTRANGTRVCALGLWVLSRVVSVRDYLFEEFLSTAFLLLFLSAVRRIRDVLIPLSFLLTSL